MNEIKNINSRDKSKAATQVFRKRLDFYWKFVALYSVVLITYSLFRGTIDEGTFSIKVLDPIVLLLLLFIAFTVVWLSIETYKDKKIIIGSDFIIFKNRFREKKYNVSDLVRIYFRKERATLANSSFRIIKLKVKNRRRHIRIKPSSFHKEAALYNNLLSLKRNINNEDNN